MHSAYYVMLVWLGVIFYLTDLSLLMLTDLVDTYYQVFPEHPFPYVYHNQLLLFHSYFITCLFLPGVFKLLEDRDYVLFIIVIKIK